MEPCWNVPGDFGAQERPDTTALVQLPHSASHDIPKVTQLGLWPKLSGSLSITSPFPTYFSDKSQGLGWEKWTPSLNLMPQEVPEIIASPIRLRLSFCPAVCREMVRTIPATLTPKQQPDFQSILTASFIASAHPCSSDSSLLKK